jgi:hypothetical protein
VKIEQIVTGTMLLLGIGFAAANARLLTEYLSYLSRRRRALLTWRGPKPPYYTLRLAIGVVLGVILFYNVVQLRSRALFGEAMMFLYYAYLFPMSRNVARGFYEDGLWSDSAFMPYNEIGGISWREGEHTVALIVISRLRNLARRLTVPGEYYAGARRLLRDKIAQHDIHFSGTGLDLLDHDEREDV